MFPFKCNYSKKIIDSRKEELHFAKYDNFGRCLWNPHWAPEVERPEMDILFTCMGGDGESRPNMVTYLPKVSYTQPLPDRTKYMEKKLSDKHRSTALQGKTQPRL